MSLPNLIIPGAGKSGTTTLHDALAQHPRVFMSSKKEPHYFSHPPSAERWTRYVALFEGSESHPVRGESSTSYLSIPEAPVRIAEVLGSPRILVILRNPVDRFASHYFWLRSKGLEPRSLRGAYVADKDETPDIRNTVLGSGNLCYYHANSSYGSNLRRFYKIFEPGRIKVVTFESLVADFAGVLKVCFEFLEVSEYDVRPIRSNPTRTVTPVRARISYLKRVLGRTAPRAWRLVDGRVPLARRIVAAADARSAGSEARRLDGRDREWVAGHLEAEVQLAREVTGMRFEEWAPDFPP